MSAAKCPTSAPARVVEATRAGRRLIGLLRSAGLALVASACLASGAQAAQIVKLQASFNPDRYGASTTIHFGFTISNSEGGLPSPLTHLDLRMPPGMNYITSSLGLATCQPAKLVERGLAGCPANSRLGMGSAFVEVPFGSNAGHEIPEIQALMGPPHNGNVVVLFYANGLAPVYAQIVFQGELVTGGGVFGEDLSAAIPLIPSVTNGPPVSIINVKSTIGPNGLTYYKRVHGRLVGYKPQGVSVPENCPRAGYPFAADFAFLDGSITKATTHVPCPPSRRRHK
jgi:hypothetical protein